MTRLEELFPGLAAGGCKVTSPPDTDYNCIGWAAGDNHHWWWPNRDVGKEYWPARVPRERTAAAFVAALATLGYQLCEGDALEPAFERIAANSWGPATMSAGDLPQSGLIKQEEIKLQPFLANRFGRCYAMVEPAAANAA